MIAALFFLVLSILSLSFQMLRTGMRLADVERELKTLVDCPAEGGDGLHRWQRIGARTLRCEFCRAEKRRAP